MKRITDDAHLKYIRGLPCLLCDDETTTESAHVRYGEGRAGKRLTGLGERPDDSWTVPLCNKHHADQHTMNEKLFWNGHGVDPVYVALALYRVSGDHEAGCRIVAANRP